MSNKLRRNTNSKIKYISFTALFTAMIFALTMLHVPIGAGGYIHIGDAVIYVTALLLGGPWAFLAAAIGAVLADLASGYAIYAIPSAVIKVFIAIPFVLVNKKSKKLLTPLSAGFTVVSGVITVMGYFAADLVIYNEGAVAGLVPNTIQAVGSAAVFILLALALDKADIKGRLKGHFNG